MTRRRTHRYEAQPQVSTSTQEPAQSIFAPRPFAVPVQTAPAQPISQDQLQASLDRASRFGHSLAKLTPSLTSTSTETPITQRKKRRSPDETSVTSPFASPLPVQTKLTVGQPGDQYEQEADRTAAQVVDQMELAESPPSPESQPAAKPTALKIQPLVQPQSQGIAQPQANHLEQSIESQRGSGTPLSQDIRKPMERSFGADFSGVTVHTDAESDHLNRSIHARAFTTQQDIFFKQGEYNPDNREGKELLAHELTHVVQQTGRQNKGKGKADTSASDSRAVSRQLIQAKLMTADELVKATGVKGALLFKSSSYEKIVDALKDYEKLEKGDKGDKKNQRIQLLGELIGYVDVWLGSKQRATVKTGDDKKKTALEQLKVQLKQERSTLLNLNLDADQQEIERRKLMPSGGRQRANAFAVGYTSQAEVEAQRRAQQRQEEQLTFTQKAGTRLKNFFHYTFGSDFNVQGISLDPKDTLLPDEIQALIDLMDKAALSEQELLDSGIGSVNALAIAYRNMPEQLKPKSAKPEAKLAIQVKRQLLQEALAKKQSPAESNTAETVMTGVEKGGSLVSSAGSGIADKISSSYKEQIKTFESAAKAGKDVSTLKETAKSGLKTTELVSGGFEVFGNVTSMAKTVYDLVIGVKGMVTAKDKLAKLEAAKALAAAGSEALSGAMELAATCAKIAETAGGAATSVVPGVKIAVNVVKIIKGLIQGIVKIVRTVNEFLLSKEAKAIGAAIKGAIKRISLRNLTLSIREGVKIVCDVLSLIGSIIEVSGGPVGPVGTAIDWIGKILSMGATVGSLLEDSYRSGLAQEAEKSAYAGEKDSETKVFKENTLWALTGIIMEAKKGNPQAVRMLKLYFITEQMIQESSIPDLRDSVMKAVEEEGDPQTITQKILGVKKLIFGR